MTSHDRAMTSHDRAMTKAQKSRPIHQTQPRDPTMNHTTELLMMATTERDEIRESIRKKIEEIDGLSSDLDELVEGMRALLLLV